jgi:hypothetical protein
MDDLFLCPDCAALHAEPAEPVLGHLARCLDCEIAAEQPATAAPQPLPLAA